VGLIGPNGAGKTTLFNAIGGLVPLSGGQVSLEGRDITGWPAHRIARLGVGRTFQSPRLFPMLTVLQHVVLSTRMRPRADASFRTKEGDEADALRALELVRLEHRAGVEASREPTGRRKLIELAMVLAARPRVLLLDEPMAGLNPGEVQFAMRLIRRIRDERGAAIFWVEHVMEAIMGVADRVVVLHHGEMLAEGTPAAVAENPQVLDAYLGERVA
jgi:branched-chain amino acid transport system ATP-binding protein